MSEYKIVRLSRENFHDFVGLYNICFHLNEKKEVLLKKYETGFTGIEFIGYLAYSAAGEAAAYYGVFPLHVIYKGERILAAQSGDTMTHPDHRGKGLFVLLAKQAYQLAAQAGVRLVFGFPNKNSYHGFVTKLNWVHKENMKCYELSAGGAPLAKVAKKFKFLSSFYLNFADRSLRKYGSKKEHFANSVTKDDNGSVEHGSDLFNYKKYSKKYLLDINGKCVWVKLDGSFWIGDIENCGQEEFLAIIGELKKIAKKIGAGNILFHTSPGTKLDGFFALVAKSKESLAVGYLDLNSGLDLSKLSFTSSDFDTF